MVSRLLAVVLCVRAVSGSSFLREGQTYPKCTEGGNFFKFGPAGNDLAAIPDPDFRLAVQSGIEQKSIQEHLEDHPYGCVCDPRYESQGCTESPANLDSPTNAVIDILDGKVFYATSKTEIVNTLNTDKTYDHALPCPDNAPKATIVDGKPVCQYPCDKPILDPSHPLGITVTETACDCKYNMDWDKAKCEDEGTAWKGQLCNWEGGVDVKGNGFVAHFNQWNSVENIGKEHHLARCKKGWKSVEVRTMIICLKSLPVIPTVVKWIPLECGPTTPGFFKAAINILACTESLLGGEEFHQVGLNEDVGKIEWNAGTAMKSYKNLMQQVMECTGFYTFVAEGVWFLKHGKKMDNACAGDFKCIEYSEECATMALSRDPGRQSFRGITGGYGLRKYQCPPEFPSFTAKDYIAMLTVGGKSHRKGWGRSMEEVWTPEKFVGKKKELVVEGESDDNNGELSKCHNRQCTEMAIFKGGQGLGQKTLGVFDKGTSLETCINNAIRVWGGKFTENKVFSLDKCIAS